MAIETVGFNLPILQPISITSGPVVNVSQFGAVGDGTKDDTAAIQSALNYIKANGGTLNFDAGRTYVVSKTLVIAGADDFKIDGNGATIKMANGTPVASGYPLLRVDTSDHFAVTELTLDGNRANRSPAEVPAHNVIIKGSHDFSFSQVNSVNAVADGFYLAASDKTDRSTYTQNALFLNCTADNGFRQGMSIINGENIQVIGGAYTNTHGTAPAAGIDIEANDGTAVPGNHNILIRGVILTGNDGYGVQLTAKGLPSNITIEGSYFADNDHGAVWLNTAQTLIKGNTFESFTLSEHALIYLGGHETNGNNVITGNSFNHINTGQAVLLAHRSAGANNQSYDNKYYDIDGPFLQPTTGMTGWDNVLTGSPTYPMTSSWDGGSALNGTVGDDQLVPTVTTEIINGHDGKDGISYLNSTSGVTVKLWHGTGSGGHAEGDTLISIEDVQGSNHNDRLGGTNQQNWLYGNGGDDTLAGLGGIDVLSGGFGKDTVYGGDGNDSIYGNDGTDALYGEGGNDRAWGGASNDTVKGEAGTDVLYGEDGDDVLYGGADGDTLLGQLGNDILYGEDGNDIFYSGQGTDRVIGGAGADTYVFDHNSTGKDIVEDFDVTADRVSLKQNINGNGISTAAEALTHVHADANGNAVLDLGQGNGVTLMGVAPTQLSTDDFIVI